MQQRRTVLFRTPEQQPPQQRSLLLENRYQRAIDADQTLTLRQLESYYTPTYYDLLYALENGNPAVLRQVASAVPLEADARDEVLRLLTLVLEEQRADLFRVLADAYGNLLDCDDWAQLYSVTGSGTTPFAAHRLEPIQSVILQQPCPWDDY